MVTTQAPYVPLDVSSNDSLDLMPSGSLPSSDDNGGEDLTKKINNLHKRINELEVVNDSLRQRLVGLLWSINYVTI